MRKENWPEILAAEIEAAAGRPFVFGSHDCCAFAMRVIHAMTGENPRDRLPHYADATTAGAILDEHGGMAGLWTYLLGEPVPVLKAGRGDVAVMPTARGPAAGVVIEAGRVVLPGAVGVRIARLTDCTQAWRVD